MSEIANWQYSEGIDGFRLLAINGLTNENKVKMIKSGQRRETREMARNFRATMNTMQQFIVDFNPAEMAPGQLTTLDAMLLGEIYQKDRF